MLAVSLKAAIGVKYGSDYIKLAVGKSVNNFPTKKMFSVGDIICFDSPLASTSHWASSNDNIIRVDANLGNLILILREHDILEMPDVLAGLNECRAEFSKWSGYLM